LIEFSNRKAQLIVITRIFFFDPSISILFLFIKATKQAARATNARPVPSSNPGSLLFSAGRTCTLTLTLSEIWLALQCLHRGFRCLKNTVSGLQLYPQLSKGCNCAFSRFQSAEEGLIIGCAEWVAGT
jgi:hypothetical protein